MLQKLSENCIWHVSGAMNDYTTDLQLQFRKVTLSAQRLMLCWCTPCHTLWRYVTVLRNFLKQNNFTSTIRNGQAVHRSQSHKSNHLKLE